MMQVIIFITHLVSIGIATAIIRRSKVWQYFGWMLLLVNSIGAVFYALIFLHSPNQHILSQARSFLIVILWLFYSLSIALDKDG